jgi:glycosyltransferase involved in cell wall biosynthesis
MADFSATAAVPEPRPDTVEADAGAPALALVQSAKICLVGLRGVPGVMGGVESHCEALLPRLSRSTPHAFTVLSRDAYAPDRQAPWPRVEVAPLWSLKNKYLEAALHTCIGVLYAALRLRPRIVHIHAIGPALFAPVPKLFGMGVVVTHHGQDYNRSKWNAIAKAALRAGENIAVRFADEIIVVSPSLAEDLKRRHPDRAERIRYIPNGADPFVQPTPQAQAAALDRFGLAAGDYILAVGRLVPEKGFHDLIRAHRLSATGKKLVIAGGADHADGYATELAKHADDNVVFTGKLARADLNALYANASLFVLPSYHEGLPIAALEAVAAGAPVVLSDIQPNLDIGLSAAHYFPVGDVEALTQRLNAPHDEFGVDRSLMSRFDWDSIAAETARVYEKLLRRPQ